MTDQRIVLCRNRFDDQSLQLDMLHECRIESVSDMSGIMLFMLSASQGHVGLASAGLKSVATTHISLGQISTPRVCERPCKVRSDTRCPKRRQGYLSCSVLLSETPQ